jgi:hypothetical protein
MRVVAAQSRYLRGRRKRSRGTVVLPVGLQEVQQALG